ncbi:MAG TPA: hypothetical protein VN930_10225 [Xanthobacteraceae bacterium]|nr:hypothetical protein [Xanthobacteraceae bacterium]
MYARGDGEREQAAAADPAADRGGKFRMSFGETKNGVARELCRALPPHIGGQMFGRGDSQPRAQPRTLLDLGGETADSETLGCDRQHQGIAGTATQQYAAPQRLEQASGFRRGAVGERVDRETEMRGERRHQRLGRDDVMGAQHLVAADGEPFRRRAAASRRAASTSPANAASSTGKGGAVSAGACFGRGVAVRRPCGTAIGTRPPSASATRVIHLPPP